jgi:hypothetical protein
VRIVSRLDRRIVCCYLISRRGEPDHPSASIRDSEPITAHTSLCNPFAFPAATGWRLGIWLTRSFRVVPPYRRKPETNGCYTAQVMKWALFVVLIASANFAQSTGGSGPVQPAGQGDSYARQSTPRRQGSEARSREQARSKQHLCAEAGEGGNARIGQCLDEQFKTTQQDYVAYVRSIGGLLRLPPPDEPASTSHGKLPFDSAEDAWLKYRDASCTSMATQWQGNQSSVAYADCRLKLTWNHMNELADLYSDLWY